MSNTLRGMELPQPRFRISPLPPDLKEIPGFYDLQTFFPTLSRLFRITKHQSNDIWLDSDMKIVNIDISGTSGKCIFRLAPNTDSSGTSLTNVSTRNAFLKVTHLLDPVRWIKGEYSLPKYSGLPWHSKTWAAAWTKLQDTSNQAYVETIASYLLGKIRDANVSPHFNQFYGAFCARAKIYRYNMTEEFRSFRNTRWFWHGQKRGLYKLHVVSANNPNEDISGVQLDEILREPSVYSSSSQSDTDEGGEVVVNIEEGEEESFHEASSVHSGNLTELSFAEESENESSSNETEMEDKYKIYAQIADFPVMMIGIEDNENTMDHLLDNHLEVGATCGTDKWEYIWSAWIFQVLAALSVAQSIIGLTHNDLHTNNIVWSSTEEEYLYYKKNSGEIFKVPTYGKIFRIIDFGRSIFTVNGKQFFSDDFKTGNDAEGQYSFKPLHPRPTEEVPPNPSFDLSRLAVSLIEALFPETPEEKEGGAILSSEDGLEVAETVSPLYNALWSWMIDDMGENVLITPSGEERFPGFDLYKHIAAHVHTAIPSYQFAHPAFDRFQVNAASIDTGAKCWSLFC